MITEICSCLSPWLDGLEGDAACRKTWVAESGWTEEERQSTSKVSG